MSNVKEAAEALSAEYRDMFVEHIRDAIYHLTECWDALRAAETMIEGEIETDAIEGLAGSIGEPSEAYGVSASDVLEALESVEV